MLFFINIRMPEVVIMPTLMAFIYNYDNVYFFLFFMVIIAPNYLFLDI